MSEQRVVQRGALSSDSSALASSTSTPSNVQPHKPTSTPVIAGTLAGCILVIACVLTFILIRKRRRRLLAEYASHFAAAAERTNFPREHPDKGGTLGKYTAQELPPRSHESSASSSGSSPALPSVHNPSPLQQQSQQHDPISSNRDNGSPDHELQSRRSRRGGSSDIPPGSSLPPVYQHTITTSQQPQPQQPNPNSTARLYPAALSATRPHSDLAGRRPHGHTDAVADLGSQEDDNNTNNNSHTLHSTSGAHNSAISGYVRRHSGVGRPRREDISEGFSSGGANAGVSPVTEDEIVGYRGEPPAPSPLNSGGGGSVSGAGGEFGENTGRRLPSSVPSTEIGRHTGERDYLEDGRRWQGTTLGTSTSVPGLEYPYSGSGAGGPPPPNEDVSSSPSAPRRSGGGPSTIIPPPPSSATTPVSSRVPSRDAQQQHYTTALSLLPPPPPHTSFSPTSRTHAHTHISDGMGGIPIREEEEEDAPPAYENIWPSARPEELRRAELHQLQQGRE